MNDRVRDSSTTTTDETATDATTGIPVCTTTTRMPGLPPTGTMTEWPPKDAQVFDPMRTPAPLSRIEQQLRGRPARYTALGAAVPATFLAAGETPADTSGPGFGEVLGVMGKIGGTAVEAIGAGFAAQPLLASAMTLGLAAAGYMKVKEGAVLGGLAGGESDGFAPPRAIRKNVSRRALVKKKTRKTLRPSLEHIPARQIPTTEVGFRLGKDRKTGIEIWSSVEDSTVTIAPMGAGKTALLGNFIIDAPGSVVATSTKVDIVRLTAEARQQTGGRTWIFNPMRLGEEKFPSNLLWDPVIGCKDPVVAIRRAKYLLDGSDITSGMENRNFWNNQSFKVLKSFLWAADMAGLSLLDVARWSKKPMETPASKIFEEYAEYAPAGWADDLNQSQAAASPDSRSKTTTLDNVFLTLSTTFECLSLPVIAQSVADAHRPDVPQFNVLEFIESGVDTVYILGEDTGAGGIGPLFTTLTGEIYEAARRRAPAQDGERNDPPVTFVPDEAALICPIPLEKWTADSRGLGIVVHSAFQSRGQIRDRWGHNGAATIWDNCTALVLGGLKGDDHLESMSKLTGTKRVREETGAKGPGPNGTTTTSSSYRYVKEPTMSPSDIMYLKPGEVLIFRRHLDGPIVARYTAAWERKDIKQLAKNNKKAAREAFKARQRKAKVAVPAPATWTMPPAAPPVAPASSPWTMPAAPTAAPAPPAMPPTAPAASAWTAPAAPASAWTTPMEPVVEEPWAPAPPATSPWTSAPAVSGWAAGGLPGPREHLRIVPGETVDSVPQPEPSEPAPIPAAPASTPTVHLEEEIPQQPAAATDTNESTDAQDTPPRRARNFGAF
ncbi:type IV secretory system conjugative DNA transfer family protein [Streptomyces sp. NPDC001339]|uniref:type IV secretory system conjugative DNA transfer family protein n=1 Tax=Streptomyces sp. NPDC001339 TaxID=3364563 RepID=UPI0036B71ABC